MIDPISTGASAVTILDRALAAIRWLLRFLRKGTSDPVSPRHPHAGLEIIPVSYQIELNQTVPRIEVELLAINYLSRAIELREAKILRLTGQGHPALDGIPLIQEPTLAPRSSFTVFCGRALADSEARQCVAIPELARLNGAVSLMARGRVGRREIQFGPACALRIGGFIGEQKARQLPATSPRISLTDFMERAEGEGWRFTDDGSQHIFDFVHGLRDGGSTGAITIWGREKQRIDDMTKERPLVEIQREYWRKHKIYGISCLQISNSGETVGIASNNFETRTQDDANISQHNLYADIHLDRNQALNWLTTEAVELRGTLTR